MEKDDKPANQERPEKIPEDHLPEAPEHEPEFVVVGIGASAGGFTALKQFLGNVSDDSGMAYVVVVHLSPEHKSHLADLLQVNCKIPVLQVTETTQIKPNEVYVIPPDANLSAIDTHLRLSALEKERTRRSPIDNFLRTLAVTHGEHAVAIILSGTGSDGVVGMSRIRERGGLTLAQDPDQAEFDGMPRSAIASNQVDRVLPVEDMPRFLQNWLQAEQHLELPSDEESVTQREAKLLGDILNLVKTMTGNDFSRYKTATILRRIRRRMQLNQVPELQGYLEFLRQEHGEVDRLFNDFLITVTSFFRDPGNWEALETQVIPKILEKHDPEEPLRAWSVGCATGEEAYTLAILLLEAFEKRGSSPFIQVFASDLHEISLNRAREGYFPQAIASDVSPERLERWFLKETTGYRVRKELREAVVFAPHNLMKDPPFSKLDLVCCRNLLIYLQREVQRNVLELFHYALKPSRYLFVGTSETVDQQDLFRSYDKKYCLYQRNAVQPSEPRLPVFPYTTGGKIPDQKGREKVPGPEISFGKLHEEMVERYGPPSVLITENHEIIHYSRNAGRFLRQPGGEPTNNLFQRVRDELRIELRATLYALNKEEKTARSKPVAITIDGEKIYIIIRACSPRFSDDEGYYLVFFDELELYEELSRTSADITDDDLQQLENELNLTKQRLQSVVEEYETSQEEMRASNEEMQSINEELRSTMEELETSKEELQSMNEELMTVNQENRNKVEELSQLSNDLQNLLSATDIATLFLDRQLRILRYTPQLGELFNVHPADRGRRLSDFTHRLGYGHIAEDAQAVLKTLQPQENEVQSQNGKWYLMRILPYRTEEDRIDGVVVTFVEISRVKRAEQELRDALEDLKNRERDLRNLNETLEQRVIERTREVQTLARNLTDAEQDERGRIAQILHDDLQQILCAIQTKFFLIQQDLKELEKNEKMEDLQEVQQWLQKGIEMSRQLTLDLNPPVLKNEGLVVVLQWLAGQMEKMHGLTVQVSSATGDIPARENTRILLFQVIRELLLNIVKHSGADKAHIVCEQQDAHIVIEVVDHGKGFDVEVLRATSQEKGGFGLFNIQERLQFFGGDLQIISAPGKGTRMKVLAPREETL